MDALFAGPYGPLIIFGLRIIDVSMAMMRMILSVRGFRFVASCIGFFEVLFWVIAAGHVLQHLNSPVHLIGYAAGFATGNFVGVSLEARIAIGYNVIHAICVGQTTTTGKTLAGLLRDEGYAVTEVAGRGHGGNVDLLQLVVKRKQTPGVVKLLTAHDPDVFITVEEVRSAYGGYIRPGGRKSPIPTLPA